MKQETKNTLSNAKDEETASAGFLHRFVRFWRSFWGRVVEFWHGIKGNPSGWWGL